MIPDSKSESTLSSEAVLACDHTDVAREVFAIEAAAIVNLAENLDDHFSLAVNLILATRGRVIVSGIGKSGLIGRKISATLASTGTPSFFMHPAEAFHGDLGMVTAEDVFVAISYSGETEELVKLLPFFTESGNRIITITGKAQSTLASHADVHLLAAVEREACPLQLAPTASTTAALVVGDALAVTLMHARGFQAHNFARNHPGGSLGRRILRRVRDEMCTDNLPFVPPSAGAEHLLDAVNDGGLGLAMVGDDACSALGIVTDGDLRRALKKHRASFFELEAQSIMTAHPVTIGIDSSMAAAFDLMSSHRITALVVVEFNCVVGVVQK